MGGFSSLSFQHISWCGGSPGSSRSNPIKGGRELAQYGGDGRGRQSRLLFDYFNLRVRGSEEEKRRGVHLDMTEWRFDNNAKKLQGLYGPDIAKEGVEEALISGHGRQGSIGQASQCCCLPLTPPGQRR